MTSKERCSELKKIRKTLADKLNINLNQTECTYEGECSGTCPKCKQEEKILNIALLKKGAVILGATALTMGLASCTLINNDPPTDLSGDIEVVEPDDDTTSGIVDVTENNNSINVDTATELEGDVVEAGE